MAKKKKKSAHQAKDYKRATKGKKIVAITEKDFDNALRQMLNLPPETK